MKGFKKLRISITTQLRTSITALSRSQPMNKDGVLNITLGIIDGDIDGSTLGKSLGSNDGILLGRTDGPSRTNDTNSDPDERLLSRLVKRQRSSASNADTTAKAILRAAMGGSGNEGAEDSGSTEAFSTAAEVMTRTLSILDRGRDAGEGSGFGGSRTVASSRLGRLMELRMGGDGDEDGDGEDEDEDAGRVENDGEDGDGNDTEGGGSIHDDAGCGH